MRFPNDDRAGLQPAPLLDTAFRPWKGRRHERSKRASAWLLELASAVRADQMAKAASRSPAGSRLSEKGDVRSHALKRVSKSVCEKAPKGRVGMARRIFRAFC